MYEKHFGLISDPFGLTPTGKQSFEHPSYRKARSYLEYALHRREGIVLISGLPGTGKTTLIKSVARTMAGTNTQMNVLSCDKLNSTDLIRLYAADLGIPSTTESVGALLIGIGQALRRFSGAGKHTVLILDEAQGLSISALEQCRLLTNYQEGDRALLQLVLVGQPDLQNKILHPELQQLHQRIISSTELSLLNESETRDYFVHRLTYSGWTDNPSIDESIYRPLFAASEGIPRWINQIGSRLLLNAFVEQRREIGREEIKKVLADLVRERLLPCSVEKERSSLGKERLDYLLGNED